VWVEENDLMEDEQNGFRKGRSCQDHLSSITSIIDTRRQANKSTFVAFVDFSKAYDRINRLRLWVRLEELGMPAKFLCVLQSLYHNVECCVRINGVYTDWFSVKIGLKQGCILSPILFNLYINSLISRMRRLGLGIDVDDLIVSLLLYADDLVLLAESKEDLQRMLDELHEWTQECDMSVNNAKTKVVHFRRGPSIPRTETVFRLGEYVEIELVDKYRYLGLVLTEFMDMNITVKYVAMAAQRALGVLIAKSKSQGGLPYPVFTKLYDTLVQPIIDYGAAIWGHKSFSCIQTVQNRAMRYYLGVGRRTPNVALQGEMGWLGNDQRQWVCVTRQWCRFRNMQDMRINKAIFKWAHRYAIQGAKNSQKMIMAFYHSIDMDNLCNIQEDLQFKYLKEDLILALSNHYETVWLEKLHHESAGRGAGRNKLRTYRKFKHSIYTETYVSAPMSKRPRSALAKFRCGVAPLRLETGRYTRTPEEERLCSLCDLNEVESEEHCLIRCELYPDIQGHLFNAAILINPEFPVLSDTEKLCFILSDTNMVFTTAKACQEILTRRSAIIYNA